MLSRLTVFSFMFIYLISCLNQQQIEPRKTKLSAESPTVRSRTHRTRRDYLAGNEFMWDDDNGLYTPSPQLDSDIVYGKVQDASRPGNARLLKKYRYYVVKARPRVMKTQEIYGDGSKMTIRKETLNGRKKVVIEKHSADGTIYRGTHASKHHPITAEGRTTKTGPVYNVSVVKEIGGKTRRLKVVKKSNNGSHTKHETLSVNQVSPDLTVFHPITNNVEEIHAERDKHGTKIQYMKRKGKRRKTVSMVHRSRHGNREFHRKVQYDTPYKSEHIDEAIMKDKLGRIVVSKKHHIRRIKPKVNHHFVVHGPDGPRVGKVAVKVPLTKLQKLDNDILHGNELSRQSANVAKAVFSRRFFNMLYNLTYHSAREALHSQHAARLTSAWSSWSNWGQCSVTCGIGLQYCTRRCLLVPGHGACTGDSVRSRSCQLHPCLAAFHGLHEWSQWGQWSSCTVTCGTGLRNRKRLCVVPVCVGSADMTDICTTPPCAIGAPGRLVFAYEGETARLKCRYDRSLKVKYLHWITPSGESITKGSANSRYGIDGDSLVIFHPQRVDSGPYRCMVQTARRGTIIARASMVVIDCTSHPCQNGGICVEKTSDDLLFPFSTFACRCPPGYYGRRCNLGIGPGGIAACVVGVVTAILLIVIVVLLCNHRNTQRVAEMADDEFLRRNKAKKIHKWQSVSYAGLPTDKGETSKGRSQSDDVVGRKKNSLRNAPASRSTMLSWKAELDAIKRDSSDSSEQEAEEEEQDEEDDEERTSSSTESDKLLLVGQTEVLGMKTSPDSNDSNQLKSILSDSSLSRGRRHSVSFDVEASAGPDAIESSNIISPPIQYSDSAARM